MKKSYLTLAAVAAIMASCSNEVLIDEPVVNDVEIGFANGFIDKTTKAELTNEWFSNDDENAFGVYGYKGSTQLFDNEEVRWDDDANVKDWTHSTVRFWDKSATNYEFYAYAPFEQTATFNEKKFSFASILAKPIVDIETVNADLAIATPLTGISYDNCTKKTVAGHGTGHVEFIFNHVLSKLSFKAKTSLDVNADGHHDVKAVTIKNISLDFPTAESASWSQNNATSVAGTTSFTNYLAKDGTLYETPVFPVTGTETKSISKDAAVEIGKTFIVAPVNTTNTEHVFGVKVTYDITYNDDKVDADCVSYGVIGGGDGSTGTQYKPAQNTNYVVTLVVGPEKIEFCVDEIKGWTNVAGFDVNVND